MGRRGPAPRPNAAKLRAGETRPSRLNTSEPVPRAAPPTKPPMVDGASEVWDHVLANTPVGQIVALDADILEAYCEAVIYRRLASRKYAASGGSGLLVQRAGTEETGPDGKVVRSGGILVKNPLHQIVRDWSNEIRLLARELGLSPAARANLSIAGDAGIYDGVEATIGPAPRLRALAGGKG